MSEGRAEGLPESCRRAPTVQAVRRAAATIWPVAATVDAALRAEFCQGFYERRQADWVEHVVDETQGVAADVAGCLAALAAGQRNFSYPRHDEQVFDLLQRLVPERGLKGGADIGCATGCFPAMQLMVGIERCTVFEVRPTSSNDARVEVRVQDLTYSEDVEPEFDLVTCLSTIEHVGLGRYGDPIDPWGDVKMARNLRRLLRPGGIMLLSFPVGREASSTTCTGSTAAGAASCWRSGSDRTSQGA